MKKNNKGFTLVELLAVIVVLAIIMVIATQQINKTINRSRAKAFNETMNIVEENARILFAEGGLQLVEDELKESLDMNDNDWKLQIEYPHDGKEEVKIKLKAKANGKFKNVNWDDLAKENSNPSFCYKYDEDDKYAYIKIYITEDGKLRTSNDETCKSWE